MDNQTIGFEDIFDMTDSENSSSSSSSPAIFENNQPFVLELHDLSKDEQSNPNQAKEKVKKLKKKKGQPANQVNKSSVSSDSISEASSVAPTIEDGGNEEFYDAHDSYHTMQPNQNTNPVVTAGQLQVKSEQNQNPKLETRSQLRGASSRDPSTTVTKPVTRPD